MATVYLSIGTVKTGTTALQTFMRENDLVMQKQGYCYPLMDIGIYNKYVDRNGHFLVYRSEKENREDRKVEEKAVRDRAYKILEESAQKHNHIILSDELIWHRSRSNPHFWERLRPNFAKIGCDVKVIVYLRRQDLLIQSLYNQSIKALPRTALTFDDYVKETQFPLDYAENLERIVKGIGRENLIVRVYESGQFEGEEHSIFSDFAKCVGLELTEDFTRNRILSNVGLNGNYLEIKRLLNALPEYQESNDFMKVPIWQASGTKVSGSHHAKTSFFTYEAQKEYLRQFDESNQRVAREYLGRENGVLFEEEVKELPVWNVEKEQMYQDIILSMGELFCAQEQKIVELQNEYNELKDALKNLKNENKSMYNSVIFRGYRKVRNGFGGKKEK